MCTVKEKIEKIKKELKNNNNLNLNLAKELKMLETMDEKYPGKNSFTATQVREIWRISL